MIHFSKITSSQAYEQELKLPMVGVIGPENENGEPCPWPWDPIQLMDAPLGQYHCPYCLAMVMAGMHHIDYKGFDDHYAKYVAEQEAKDG